jgi:hypothetical protein
MRKASRFITLGFAALVTLAAQLPHACWAAVVATDNFESNSTSGGSGWSGPWSFTAGNYVNGQSKIDGTYTLGEYGQSVGTRLISPSITTAGTTVTLSFSVRADWDVRHSFSGSEIGVNIVNGSSNALFTTKFVSGDDNVRVNDGGGDFGLGTLTFAANDVYDFSFSTVIGSNQYSFTASHRGTGESVSASNFTYSNGRVADSLGGLAFFVNAPGGSGNDGFLDNAQVVSAVPESSAIGVLAALGLAAVIVTRRLAG